MEKLSLVNIPSFSTFTTSFSGTLLQKPSESFRSIISWRSNEWVLSKTIEITEEQFPKTVKNDEYSDVFWKQLQCLQRKQSSRERLVWERSAAVAELEKSKADPAKYCPVFPLLLLLLLTFKHTHTSTQTHTNQWQMRGAYQSCFHKLPKWLHWL